MQENYIKEIKLGNEVEIPISYPQEIDQKQGHITVICGKNHSGKSYILKKVSEALKERHKYTEGTLECNGTNLTVEFSNRSQYSTLPEVNKILSIGDPTSTKRIYEEINSITFENNIFVVVKI